MLQNQCNEDYTNNYRELNKRVKAEVKKQKNDHLSEKISEMEDNFKKNNTHKLYKQVREGKRYTCYERLSR